MLGDVIEEVNISERLHKRLNVRFEEELYKLHRNDIRVTKNFRHAINETKNKLDVLKATIIKNYNTVNFLTIEHNEGVVVNLVNNVHLCLNVLISVRINYEDGDAIEAMMEKYNKNHYDYIVHKTKGKLYTIATDCHKYLQSASKELTEFMNKADHFNKYIGLLAYKQKRSQFKGVFSQFQVSHELLKVWPIGIVELILSFS